jgi:hypothetical protein
MLTSTACAPALLWYGHDPARLVRWELRSENGVAWLESRPVAEGARAARATSRRTDAFDEIVVAELVFGAAHTGGRFAVPARRGDRWYVLSDRGSGPGWDGVASLRFSPEGGQLVYLGQQASRWHVVRDGEWRSPGYDAIVDGTLTWSRGGRRVGYAAEMGGCVRVLADRAPTRGCYRDVRGLVVGEEPAEDAFVVVPENDGASAERGGRMRLLRGGATLAEADEIVGLALTPAGKLGYAMRDGATWHFVLDGRREGPYPWLRSATFSRSGRRHGYVAGLPDGRSGVIIDGAPRCLGRRRRGGLQPRRSPRGLYGSRRARPGGDRLRRAHLSLRRRGGDQRRFFE